MKALVSINFSPQTGLVKAIGQVATTDGRKANLNATTSDNQTNAALLADLKSQFVTQLVAAGINLTAADVLIFGAPQ